MTSAMDVDSEVSPMHENYIESLVEPWKTIALKAVPAATEANPLSEASARLEQLEIDVRSRFVNLFFETDVYGVVGAAGNFWRKTLDLCLNFVCEASKPKPLPAYENMTPRRLPILLLEDGLDALSVSDAQQFWLTYVEPTLDGPDHLLGDLMWKSSNACNLPFLRVCNQFLRILDNASQSSQYEWQGRILTALAKAFSVADRSALKLWGTFRSGNANAYESEDIFDEYHPAVKEITPSSSSQVDYDLYESFWSLQSDFSNPNHIQIGPFMKKLKMVLEALESAASIRSDSSTAPKCDAVRYLTASSLLPTQLSSPDFRTSVVSQFLIVSSHLSSESAALANALTPFLSRAKKLLEKDDPELYHLLWETILQHREDAWRRWKKDKCPMAAFAPKQKPPAASAQNGERTLTMNGPLGESDAPPEQEYQSLQTEDLVKVSQELQKTVPSLEDHLEPYVEALDPESGIEADYHPGNDPLFAWRAMRLFAKHQLPLIKQCRKPQDLERITRELYRAKGNDIPGEMAPPSDNEVDEESVQRTPNDQQEMDGKSEQDDEEETKSRDGEEEDGSSNDDSSSDEGSHSRETEEKQAQPTSEAKLKNESEDKEEANEAMLDNDMEDSVEAQAGSGPIDTSDLKPETDDSKERPDESMDKEPTKDHDENNSKEGSFLGDKTEKPILKEDPATIEATGKSTGGPDTKSETTDTKTGPYDARDVKGANDDENKRVGRQPRGGGGRQDRDKDRKRRRSASVDRVNDKAPRRDHDGGRYNERRGGSGGRGGRRDDGSSGGRDRGRRDTSPPGRRGDRREEGGHVDGRGPPPEHYNVGSSTGSRGGGRYDDRSGPPSRGGRLDGPPPSRRADDGPPPRGGRGGGGRRGDDRRRGRDSFSGGGRR